jgi:hypothetical protein
MSACSSHVCLWFLVLRLGRPTTPRQNVYASFHLTSFLMPNNTALLPPAPPPCITRPRHPYKAPLFPCKEEGCGKVCHTRGGLKQHITAKHIHPAPPPPPFSPIPVDWEVPEEFTVDGEQGNEDADFGAQANQGCEISTAPLASDSVREEIHPLLDGK